jgi:hypothetical protein
MEPMAIVVSFFLVLAALLAATAFAQKKTVRVVSALAAFGWACLMFVAANWAESLNYNIWYSNAAYKMLDAYIRSIHAGRQDAVVTEMRRMTNDLVVTYENKGNFKGLAERAAANLTIAVPEQGSGTNHLQR